MYLERGRLFDTEALKLSIRRINQLGYFKPMEGAPEIAPSALGEDKLDVTFKVEEQNRNQFTFGGGMSGPEGAFVNASLLHRQLPGSRPDPPALRAERRRTKHYQIGLTEPYLFDRPITAAFDIFKPGSSPETFTRWSATRDEGTGGSFTVRAPAGPASPRSTRTTPTRSSTSRAWATLLESIPLPGTRTSRSSIPSCSCEDGRQHESRLSPSFVLNTVDNPWTPRSGMKLTLTPQLSGGPLGGSVSLFKPKAESSWSTSRTRGRPRSASTRRPPS